MSTRLLRLAVILLSHLGAALAASPQIAAPGLVLDAEGKVFTFGSDNAGQLGLGRLLTSALPLQVPGLDRVRDVALGGYGTVFALHADGSVQAWGGNSGGLLMDGTVRDRATPLRVPDLDGVTAISPTYFGALALKADGSVWSWGPYDAYRGSSRPVQVQELGNVVQVRAMSSNMVALRADGTVWIWGYNHYGQFGNGSYTPCGNPCLRGTEFTVPQKVPGLTGVVALAHGSAVRDSLLVVKSDGSVWGWGDNSYGQLGDGTFGVQASPKAIPGLSGITALASDGDATLALRADGTVMGWSGNMPGTSRMPVRIEGLSRIVSLSAASGLSAVDADGRVWTWGYSFDGQLGNGSNAFGVQPRRLDTIADVRLVRMSDSTAIAVKKDGTVWAWGSNRSGQFGSSLLNSNVATRVPSLGDVTSLAAGFERLALGADGSVWKWGAGLGTPTRVDGLPRIAAVAVGSEPISLAVAADGTVWGWGNPVSGVLGRGAPAHTVTRVAGLGGVVAAAAGATHALFLRNDGTVLAMGANFAGQLGARDDGSCRFSWLSATQRCSDVPVQVSGLGDVVAVRAVRDSSFALKRDGSVWAWGANTNGDLGVVGGNCSFDYGQSVSFPCYDVPQRLTIPEPVSALSERRALSINGTVWSWGWNARTQQYDPVPTLLPVPTGVTAIATSGQSTTFMRQDGSLWGLGVNTNGELGDGTYADAFAPVRVVNQDSTAPVSLLLKPIDQDPLSVLQRVASKPGWLNSTITDPRLQEKTAQVYFTALLPKNSVILTGKPAASRLRPLSRRAGPAAAADTGGGMVVGVFTRDGFKQTAGGYVQADSAYSGTLSRSTALTVYDLQIDPLENSGALICMGVALPDQSAKGQVLMRPIATGTALPGVVQCPPVQTGATIQQFQAEASGPLSARTLTARITPLAEDRGKVRKLYSWAVTPNGTQYMQTGPAFWELMTEPMQPVATITVPAVGDYRLPVTQGLDLSGLVGTHVFIGIGDSWEDVRTLNKAGHYHTVQ